MQSLLPALTLCMSKQGVLVYLNTVGSRRVPHSPGCKKGQSACECAHCTCGTHHNGGSNVSSRQSVERRLVPHNDRLALTCRPSSSPSQHPCTWRGHMESLALYMKKSASYSCSMWGHEAWSKPGGAARAARMLSRRHQLHPWVHPASHLAVGIGAAPPCHAASRRRMCSPVSTTRCFCRRPGSCWRPLRVLEMGAAGDDQRQHRLACRLVCAACGARRGPGWRFGAWCGCGSEWAGFELLLRAPGPAHPINRPRQPYCYLVAR